MKTLALFAMLLAAGCLDLDVDVAVQPDGSGTYTARYTFDEGFHATVADPSAVYGAVEGVRLLGVDRDREGDRDRVTVRLAFDTPEALGRIAAEARLGDHAASVSLHRDAADRMTFAFMLPRPEESEMDGWVAGLFGDRSLSVALHLPADVAGGNAHEVEGGVASWSIPLSSAVTDGVRWVAFTGKDDDLAALVDEASAAPPVEASATLLRVACGGAADRALVAEAWFLLGQLKERLGDEVTAMDAYRQAADPRGPEDLVARARDAAERIESARAASLAEVEAGASASALPDDVAVARFEWSSDGVRRFEIRRDADIAEFDGWLGATDEEREAVGRMVRLVMGPPSDGEVRLAEDGEVGGQAVRWVVYQPGIRAAYDREAWRLVAAEAQVDGGRIALGFSEPQTIETVTGYAEVPGRLTVEDRLGVWTGTLSASSCESGAEDSVIEFTLATDEGFDAAEAFERFRRAVLSGEFEEAVAMVDARRALEDAVATWDQDDLAFLENSRSDLMGLLGDGRLAPGTDGGERLADLVRRHLVDAVFPGVRLAWLKERIVPTAARETEVYGAVARVALVRQAIGKTEAEAVLDFAFFTRSGDDWLLYHPVDAGLWDGIALVEKVMAILGE